MRRFWANVAERTTCRNCGHDDMVLQRSHYETRGNFHCPKCDARGIYHHTNRSQRDVTTGSITTNGVEHCDRAVADGGTG